MYLPAPNTTRCRLRASGIGNLGCGQQHSPSLPGSACGTQLLVGVGCAVAAGWLPVTPGGGHDRLLVCAPGRRHGPVRDARALGSRACFLLSCPCGSVLTQHRACGGCLHRGVRLFPGKPAVSLRWSKCSTWPSPQHAEPTPIIQYACVGHCSSFVWMQDSQLGLATAWLVVHVWPKLQSQWTSHLHLRCARLPDSAEAPAERRQKVWLAPRPV